MQRVGIVVFVVAVLCAGSALARRNTPIPVEVTGSAYPSLSPASAAAIDTQIVASWTFDDVGGDPDAQGWISVDRTTQALTYFHVDDFNGLFPEYTPLAGTKSMWCGARPCENDDVCYYATLPGYGDDWRQQFASIPFAVTGDVEIGFEFRYDAEASYDRIHLEYAAGDGVWHTVTQWTGVGTTQEQLLVPAANHDGTIRFRFRFQSDGGFSDEDGFYPSNGAVVIDDLWVSDGTGILDIQTFEFDAVGSYVTGDGDWQGSPMPGFGDYAGLFDGDTVVQEPPTTPNTTNLWGFFNGSPDTYECGGFPGQPAVPFGKLVEGVLTYIHNEIQSPAVSVNSVPTGSAFFIQFDVYRKLPQANVVFYEFRVRSRVAGVWEWQGGPYVFWGDGPDWFTFTQNITNFIPAGATDVQVGIAVRDLCASWCGLIGNGACHSHSPLIDNVRVLAIPGALTVSNTLTSGPGSFAQALVNANASPDMNLIQFNISGAGPHQVPTNGAVFTQPIVIDGFSEPSSNPNTNPIDQPCNADLKIEMLGGVTFQADNSEILGVAIDNVTLQGNDGWVRGCYVGVATDGGSSLFNPGDGIVVTGIDCIVGGKTPFTRNVIAGHGDHGVLLAGSGAVVEGNFIGTAATGMTSVTNWGGAVHVTGSTNLVGGAHPQARNVIGGFPTHGIFIDGNPASTNQVRGNYIGLNRTGAALINAYPSGNAGIELVGGDVAGIGGAGAGEGNVIAGQLVGVLVGSASTGHSIYGNYFGTDASGTAALGIGTGVQVASTATGEFWIGGSAPGQGNRFRGTVGAGVEVRGGTGIRIWNNSMAEIGGLGIDLFPVGVTPNDAGDGDAGANNLQNFPDLTSAIVDATSTTVAGTLSSIPGKGFTIQFFSSTVCNGSGHGAGETYLGNTHVTADGSGLAPFNVVLPVPSPPGSFITATASFDVDITSEFSACVTAVNTPTGSGVVVQPVDEDTGTSPVTLTFDTIAGAGITTLVIEPSGPPLPGSFTAGSPLYYNVTTTASFSGNVEVCLAYDEGTLLVPEGSLQMLHWDGVAWSDVTTSLDTSANVLCGVTTSLSPFVIGAGTATGVGAPGVPHQLALHANVPNPFNPTTTITYDVPAGGADVTIRVYDVSGRVVRTLVSGNRPSGMHSAVWDGRNDAGEVVSSGVYFYRMVSGSFSEARRMVLLK